MYNVKLLLKLNKAITVMLLNLHAVISKESKWTQKSRSGSNFILTIFNLQCDEYIEFKLGHFLLQIAYGYLNIR
jgi:hypothetical protein